MSKNRTLNPNIASGRIDVLDKDEIFVFGSNLAGQHKGGAARAANMKFGAEWGVGVGLTGQAYAIPTMQGGVDTIRPYVDEFIEFAKAHTDLKFLVTRIGCGIAGFKDEEIAPLFTKAMPLFSQRPCLSITYSSRRSFMTSSLHHTWLIASIMERMCQKIVAHTLDICMKSIGLDSISMNQTIS